MSGYEPPYKLTLPIVNLTASISEKIGWLDAQKQEKIPVELRRANMIQAVHSSLVIEGNTLTLEQASKLLETTSRNNESKQDIEMRNAVRAYEKLGEINPFWIEEIKKAHAVMMAGLDWQAGQWRNHGEGVYRGNELIFMAPPAERVPILMNDLFGWMRAQKNAVHPLILSSVFHYEFVFIHPFGDGNGRVARLWQSAILAQWQEVCAWLPVETMVKKHQQEYYQAINNCNRAGEATEFIEFMLAMIEETVRECAGN